VRLRESFLPREESRGAIRQASATLRAKIFAMKTKTFAAIATALSFAPTLAHAHPGHGDGFSAGLAHPVMGLDHILAMAAVGLWASQLGGRSRWVVPAAFVGMMMMGNALGVAGIAVPFVEPAIVCSVILLGVLVLAAARLPLAVGVAVAGGFALFHGLAHGAEVPANASGLAFTLGFALVTSALHACGLVLGVAVERFARAPWLRIAGGAITAAGAMLAVS
jgi:urease accessory protein